ncbi:hypothetical protein [Arthrobacter sp. A5]|uniref:hypothetical protein n=1 Tax=Arthrobacter sp. A5 TaxID=576926 RepID=UPI003DA90A0A
MLRYLPDTYTVIFILKNRPAYLREKFNGLSGTLAMSTVVLSELIYGAECSATLEANIAQQGSSYCPLMTLPPTTVVRFAANCAKRELPLVHMTS